MVTAEGLLLLALVLLPGAHARWVSLSKTPVPWEHDYRSALQDLIDTLLYAIITGATSVLLLATFAVAFAGRELDVRVLTSDGPTGFDPGRRVEGMIWVFAYLIVALMTAEGVGSGQLLLRARVIAQTLFYPRTDWTHSTVWAWAIDTVSRPLSPSSRVFVAVRTRDGTNFAGILGQYPVVGDDKDKDFVISEPKVWSDEKRAYEELGPPLLLLNSRDCKFLFIGPEKSPGNRTAVAEVEADKRIGAAITFLPVAALVAFAALALARLLALETQDALVKLLEAFCVQLIAWPTLEALRRAALTQIRQGTVLDRLWLLMGLALLFGLTCMVLGSPWQLTSVSLLIAGAAIVLLLRGLFVLSKMPPTTPTPAVSGDTGPKQ